MGDGHVLDHEVVGQPPGGGGEHQIGTGREVGHRRLEHLGPATHTVSWVPAMVTTTWVVAFCRVGMALLVATQLGMPATGPPSAMPTKLADGSAPCLKLARPTATPLIPE